MPRKGENIYKRKDGRWEGRYVKGRDGKKAIYGYVYSKSYSEVKKKLILKRAEYALEENKPSSSMMKDALFSELSEMWLCSIKSSVRESTWIKYRNILKCNIVPRLGNRNLSEIDYSVISALCNDLMESGGKDQSGLATKTVADALSLTKAVIKYASRMKYITDCTALDVSVKVKNASLRILSVQEQQILISELTEELNLPGLGIYLCLFTGIRVGELCALTWDDISLENNMIHIHRTMQRIQTPDSERKTAILISKPKSQCSIRDIPIAGALREKLVQQAVKKGYVLTGNKTSYIEPRTMQNRFKAIVERCGIRDVHFHTLRHTFATRCIEVGFDVKSLSEILGHANVSITLNRYVHPSMELKQKNMDKLSKLFTVK
ncbi:MULTISPECIES: tyrosine-type recombinase/integrase [Blautia]|jgi:integrase|uniref:tyrosine-type recombinase/integrase n=1 Tax=Blautia TaxID=572511 RepID=UPI00156FF483|nr:MULTISPECIES: site-specific integrase [Blautia]MCQ4799660.1 site-specific integrase [Blautia sp. MSK.18.38]NSJ96665.1 site-specific integrase [Blautia massiliensis (ex Durand et al. 2017)]